MLKLATILDNPGEPIAETRYRDPAQLRKLGYNGVVFYETTGLSGITAVDDIADDEMRNWVAGQFDKVAGDIERAVQEELDVYLTYDLMSLERGLVERQTDRFSCADQNLMLCPASDGVLEASMAALGALLDRFKQVRGVVLRFGDNDAARLPHLIGNDIYAPHCARCSGLGRGDRICRIIEAFYHLVVKQRHLQLIARAWNVRPNGLHDDSELCRRVQQQLPDDDRLILSFKFTQTDFWRYQHWNRSSLVCGDRPIIYELECQREFEAKGAIPNWQVPLWRDGCPEVNCGEGDIAGLAAASKQVNLVGLWAWVRGGGWGGPFICDETWIDANVFAVPRLADQCDVDPAELAGQWIHQRLGVTDAPLGEALLRLVTHSPQTILEGFYIGAFAHGKADPWRPNADWIQDDLLDAAALWRLIQQLPDSVLDEVTSEKQRAVDRLAKDRAALQQDHSRRIEPLRSTLAYAEALLRTMSELIAGLAAYRRFQHTHTAALATSCQTHLSRAQTAWNHHTQRCGSLPGAATPFRETGFWDLTQRILTELS